ncbi:MAG: hypothetical protein AAF568_12110 [Pseudomonadota bacterium]
MPEELVGWRCTSPQAALAFFPPEPLPQACSASLGIRQRIYQVRAPYDLTVRCSKPGVLPVRFERDPESGLSQSAYESLVTPVMRFAQRDTQTAAIQVSLNLMLVTEAVAALTLLPPCLAPGFRDWPGPLVSGRFPLRAWPRALNAVLEWQDRDRPWILRRGEPMAYLWVQFQDPELTPRFVEAASTPVLKRHFAQVDNVSSFGRNVAPMFAEAEARRPRRLLQEKRTGCPGFS